MCVFLQSENIKKYRKKIPSQGLGIWQCTCIIIEQR